MAPALLNDNNQNTNIQTKTEPKLFNFEAEKANEHDKVGITVGEDGSSVSISFQGRDEGCNPSYLLHEGMFYHAKHTPDALCLRLPSSKDNSSFIDVSYFQAASIVQVLTVSLKKQLKENNLTAGPGVVVAVLALPNVHAYFHSFALWQLGCTVQWFNHELGRAAVDQLTGHGNVKGTNAAALLHCGLTVDEKEELGVGSMECRIGVKPIEISEDQYAIAMTKRQDLSAPREPISQEEYSSTIDEDQVMFCIHTSGSTGIPKVVNWSAFAVSRFVKPPPHVQINMDKFDTPLMLISRAYWGTSSFLMLACLAVGCSVAYCHPENRLYPSTKLALDATGACNAGSLLLYPGQIPDLCDLVLHNKHYAKIVSSITTIQWCGAAMDTIASQRLEALKLPVVFMNLHGMSEVGFSGMMTFSAPYNGLQSLSDFALWEPVDDNASEDQSPQPRLLKLWISVDKHPVAWYMLAKKYSPIETKRFPGPGPMFNRPAVDTGDIFEERIVGTNGEKRYYHHSRDDDVIRLSNLYRPDVGELEARFSASLTKVGRLPFECLDAVQILGDKKARMALVLQLRKNKVLAVSRKSAERSVTLALNELDKQLPESVKFKGLDRVKIVSISDVAPEREGILLKTHKGTLKRRLNVMTLSPWLDSLDVC